MTTRPVNAANAEISAASPTIRGPGSRRHADRIAGAVARATAQAAAQLVQESGTAEPLHIDRLRLRLPSGAGEGAIAKALGDAIARAVASRRGGQ